MISPLKRLLFVVFLVIIGCKEAKKEVVVEKALHQFSTPLGKEFIIQEPSGQMLDLYEKAKKDFKDNPQDGDIKKDKQINHDRSSLEGVRRIAWICSCRSLTVFSSSATVFAKSLVDPSFDVPKP